MVLIRKWDPFRELESLQGSMNRLFDESIGRTGMAPGDRQGVEWLPPVDVFEEENKFVVKAELPDIDQKDINIRVQNNVLTIRGEKKLEQEDKKENYHLIERTYGSFVRSFNLPQTVDAEKVEAVYEKGVLKVSLPKKEETKPREINVKVKT